MSARGDHALAAVEERPGRSCPLSYRYSPRVFDRPADFEAATVYVVGGLYGNLEALEAVLRMAEEESEVTLVFNGDFHWFDVDPADYAAIERGVAPHLRLRGNVETELAGDDPAAGCGCAYPADVSDAEVGRSNAILERLRQTARTLPEWRAALSRLPMHLVAGVGDARIGIVHGDAASLAGWSFAASRLDAPGHRRWIEDAFALARVEGFACTHTCLPALRTFASDGATGVIANNGATGMPNFEGTRFGLLTRISLRPCRAAARVYGVRTCGLHVDALRVEYDHDAWMRRFLASWPEGSAAHQSYHRRMLEGPRHSLHDAAPRA